MLFDIKMHLRLIETSDSVAAASFNLAAGTAVVSLIWIHIMNFDRLLDGLNAVVLPSAGRVINGVILLVIF